MVTKKDRSLLQCVIIAKGGQFVHVIPGRILPLSVHHEDGQVMDPSANLNRVLTTTKLCSFTVMDETEALSIIIVNGQVFHGYQSG